MPQSLCFKVYSWTIWNHNKLKNNYYRLKSYEFPLNCAMGTCGSSVWILSPTYKCTRVLPGFKDEMNFDPWGPFNNNQVITDYTRTYHYKSNLGFRIILIFRTLGLVMWFLMYGSLLYNLTKIMFVLKIRNN